MIFAYNAVVKHVDNAAHTSFWIERKLDSLLMMMVVLLGIGPRVPRMRVDDWDVMCKKRRQRSESLERNSAAST